MYSTLEICIISASNLSTVEEDADVYVVASLICSAGEFPAAQSTTIASAKYDNPTWNFPVIFAVSDLIAPNSCRIVCLPIYDLLDSENPKLVRRRIRNRFGAPIGELKLSYKFSEVDEHRWRMPTPSAPPLPPPPDPPPSRGGGRDFRIKAAIAVAATIMAPQMADFMVKVQELVVAAIALSLVFFVLVGVLIFLRDLFPRLAANRSRTRD